MRIQTDLKDYYDCAQQYGQDNSLVYKRYANRQELEFYEYPLVSSAYYHSPDDRIDFPFNGGYNEFVVGFCGKIYYGIDMAGFRKGEPGKDGYWHHEYCYTPDHVERFVRDELGAKQLAMYRNGPLHRPRWGYKSGVELVKDYFEKGKKLAESKSKFFADNYCPIFVATRMDPETKKNYATRHNTMMVIHSPLKPVNFARVFDPHTAYQEIQMFLGSLAVPMKPIPTHSDELKAEIAGFDKKFSFRKDPIRKRK